MVTIGYHCSHEQFAPGELLGFVQSAEQAGFQAAMCSDHFHPWSDRQGQSGFAWSWLGAAMQATRLPFGVVNAPGAAVSPRDHRTGRRDPGRDVSRAVLDGPGERAGAQRAHHRRPLDSEGGAAGTSQRGRRHHPGPLRRRGGRPQPRAERPHSRPPGEALQPSRGAAPDHRRRGLGRDRRVGGFVGRRAHHRREAAGRAAAGRRGLPPRRRRGQANAPPGPDLLCRRRGRGAGRPTTSGGPTSWRAACSPSWRCPRTSTARPPA